MRSAPIERYKGRNGDPRWRLGSWENTMASAGVDVMNWASDDTVFKGRMVDDAMRAVMGMATGNEIRAAIRDITGVREIQEQMLAATLEEGRARGMSEEQITAMVLSNDDSPEASELRQAVAERMARDTGAMERFKQEFKSRLGDGSPVVSRPS